MGNCAGTDFLSKKVRCTGRTARVRPVPPYCSCTFPHYLLLYYHGTSNHVSVVCFDIKVLVLN